MTAKDKFIQSRTSLFEQNGIVAVSKYVDTTGDTKRIHYLEMGQGDPLILLHGGGSHSSEWYTILKPLAEHYHLYVVDRPGCGLTDAKDYRGIDFRSDAIDFVGSFMDTVGLEKASFLGQSMGGYFALTFALENPERAQRLILIGAPAGMNRWIPPLLRALGTSRLNKILANTVAKPSLKGVKDIYRMLLVADPSRLDEVFVQHCYDGQILPGYQVGFLSLLETVTTWSGWRKELFLGDELDGLQMPVRFIWGDKDAFEKPAIGMTKANKIRDSRFAVVEDAGHCPWLDQPQQCAELVLEMMQT